MALVESCVKKRTAFLKAEIHRDMVKVTRNGVTGKTLNPFWTVWLQELVLTEGVRRGLQTAVALDNGQAVTVRTDLSLKDTQNFVIDVARAIRPMEGPPIERTDKGADRCRSVRWYIRGDESAVVESLQGLRLPLPSLARVYFSRDDIVLQQEKGHPLKLSELALRVEWNVAKALDPQSNKEDAA